MSLAVVGAKGGYKAIRTTGGFQQISGPSNTSLTVPAKAKAAWLSVTGQDVRVRADGTNPTASVGVQLKADQEYLIEGDLLNHMVLTQEAATAVVDIQYLQ